MIMVLKSGHNCYIMPPITADIVVWLKIITINRYIKATIVTRQIFLFYFIDSYIRPFSSFFFFLIVKIEQKTAWNVWSSSFTLWSPGPEAYLSSTCNSFGKLLFLSKLLKIPFFLFPWSISQCICYHHLQQKENLNLFLASCLHFFHLDWPWFIGEINGCKDIFGPGFMNFQDCSVEIRS